MYGSGFGIWRPVECELWGWRWDSNMDVKKDGGEGSWSPSGMPSAPPSPSCYKCVLVTCIFLFLIIGIFVGLAIGESSTPEYRLMVLQILWTNQLLLLCDLLAYLVQEPHEFLETVELKGLKYNQALQDENSGFSVILSTALKSKVSLFHLIMENSYF